MIDEKVLEKIKPGAVVRVTESVKETGKSVKGSKGSKTRASYFKGIVLARKHGKEAGATFTVRAEIAGEGVEKVYPIYSPRIKTVEIISSPKKVRRAKLYFVRGLPAKKIKRKLRI